MDIARIHEILAICGGEVDAEDQPLPGTELVDVWVQVALLPSKVREYEQEMIELLREWPDESWGQPVPPLGQEIDYITAGAVLGDQGRALILFAFGKLLGWWQIMDPHTMLGLSKDDELAKQMAGMGMIAIMGYSPARVTT